MQVNGISNGPQFSGVIPLKVKIDNAWAASPENIEKSCRQLTAVLTTRPKNRGINYQAIVKYMEKDHDYVPKHIFAVRDNNPQATSSDFVRVIHQQGRSYLVTGSDVDLLRIAGKKVGYAKAECKRMGYPDSIELRNAKETYSTLIKNLVDRSDKRVTEGYDENGRKIGSPLELIVNMKSNGKYGFSTFKLKLDSIDFAKAQ